MQLSMPIVLATSLVCTGCVTSPLNDTASQPLELLLECQGPRNDVFNIVSKGETYEGWQIGATARPLEFSCYGHANEAVYCNADQSDCSKALVNNSLLYEVEPKGNGTFRVHGQLTSEYGSRVRYRSSVGGMVTEASEQLHDSVPVIATGTDIERFDTILSVGGSYFVPGFAESGVRISVNQPFGIAN
ncbi:MAG: hypothetical protein ACFHHU_00945 [Porticoccaceae bacterium]